METVKKPVEAKAKKSNSSQYINAVSFKFNQFLTKQFLKTENVAINLKDNQITISGLNEEQLLNLKLFSKSYLESLRVYCGVTSAKIAIKNGVYQSFDQLKYLANLAIRKNTNSSKKKYIIKPFHGNNYGNYTKNIHDAVDMLTDISLIVPTTLNYERKYELQFKLYERLYRQKST
jgi:hypothetical protein